MQIIRTSPVPPPPRKLVTNGGEEHGNAFRDEFDPDIETPSGVVVDTVAFIHNVDPVELAPLASTIDPEALDSMLTSPAADAETVRITFAYENLQIRITSDGRLWLRWNEQK